MDAEAADAAREAALSLRVAEARTQVTERVAADPMGKLDGQSALVSGAASGIGLAIAALFLEQGAHVIAADINAPALSKAVADLESLGHAYGVSGDVRSMADAAAMVDAAVDKSGGLDVLVCNAAITSVMPIEQLAESEWDAVLATNVRGMFTLVKQAVPHMIARGGCRDHVHKVQMSAVPVDRQRTRATHRTHKPVTSPAAGAQTREAQ